MGLFTSIFSKKGLEDLKKDFPLIQGEVGAIVVDAIQKCGVKNNNLGATMPEMYKEAAAQLKSKLGYKLTAQEMSEFLNSRQFTKGGEGNEKAAKLADIMLSN